MDKISKAVPASKPLFNTVREIWSGFSNTSVCSSEEPTVVTIPSPTRAMMVASPAPPTKRSILARTVTRARTFSSIPFLATAEIIGVSITFGLTDICTASNTSRPAKSMAAERSKVNSIVARSAAINASTTRSTSPPAK